MAVTARGIWTPDSGDDYDLTTDLRAMADTIDDAIGAPIVLGKFCKTNGTQTITTTSALVTGMTSRILQGGISFDSASGGVTVTKAGIYEISMLVYSTGDPIANITMGISNSSDAVVNTKYPVISLSRTNTGIDERAYTSFPVSLAAGETMRLVAVAQALNPKIFGGANNQGSETTWAIRGLQVEA